MHAIDAPSIVRIVSLNGVGVNGRVTVLGTVDATTVPLCRVVDQKVTSDEG